MTMLSETENYFTVLKKKPKWVSCVVLTSAVLVVTLSAVALGAVIGYMYCYIEHRIGFLPGDSLSQPANVQIVHVLPGDGKNRTINGAIMSSVFMTKLISLGRELLHETCSDDDDLEEGSALGGK